MHSALEHALNRTCRGRTTQMLIGAIAAISTFSLASAAHAGTYVINDCPSAPGNPSDSGPWTVFGAPQNTKGTCTGGVGSWIGPEGGSMSPGALDGVQVATPGGSGISIRHAKVWWSVPQQTSGATTFALAAVNSGLVEEADTPKSSPTVPDEWALPSSTTEITLADYCSNDDAGNGCYFGQGENPNLEFFGAELTLETGELPSGSVTGGALAGGGTLSGTGALTFSAQDSYTGVRSVQLLLDGKLAAQKDYITECPYTNFAACPTTRSDTISWDTAQAPDGSHELALQITNAATNTTIIDDHTITTHNSPTFSSTPTVAGSATIGGTLTATAGTTGSDPDAGPLKTRPQWERCNSTGSACVAIPGATGTSYNLAADDEAHTLRYLETATNNDGSTVAESAAFGPIQPVGESKEAKEKREAKEAAETKATKEAAEAKQAQEAKEAKEKSSSTGTNGANGINGTDGTASADVVSAGTPVLVSVSPGGSLGLVPLGSSAKWVVSLKVSPTRVRRHTRIKLTGTVSTNPRPTNGKLIDLQARSAATVWKGHGSHRHRVTVYGKWVTFQALRATTNGTFSSSYTFKLGGNHTYQFQAVAPAEGQYLNPTGTSPISTVHEI
jgi:hypothetical protein